MKTFLPALALTLASVPALAQECPSGTCAPPEDMAVFVTLLQQQKCRSETSPKITVDPVTILTDHDGRIYFSGAEPKPYRLQIQWCNYDIEATGQLDVVAAVQVPPEWGFRFRPKAYLGAVALEPFYPGAEAADAVDAGLMVDFVYWRVIGLNVVAGARSAGAGLSVDISKNFGAYVGYGMTWTGHSSPTASLWFAFW